MPVKKPEIEKKNWAPSIIRRSEVMILIWSGVNPGAISFDRGVAKTKTAAATAE